MKTRLISVTYLGFTATDKRLSNVMLPWLLREIRATCVRDKLSITIEDGCLKAYNENFEPVIVHRLVDIVRASQVPGRPDELFYILLNEKEGLLHCYLFKTNSDAEVSELFTQMREPSPQGYSPRGSSGSLNAVTKNIGFQQTNSSEHLPWNSPAVPSSCNTNLTNESQAGLVRSISNASALTSLCADLSPSDSHFFEVLYIGKVRISQRKVPESLIDDALNKFAQHEAEKVMKIRRHSLLSSTGVPESLIDDALNKFAQHEAEKVMKIRRHSLLSSTGTSVYTERSNESTENLQDSKENLSNKKLNFVTSTTPLGPEKTTPWKSIENLKEKPKDIDKEFDMFSVERGKRMENAVDDKKCPVPLEPNVVVLTPKTEKDRNLSTVTEDEEKYDIHASISDTVSSITEFCQSNFLKTELCIREDGNDNSNTKEKDSTDVFKSNINADSKEISKDGVHPIEGLKEKSVEKKEIINLVGKRRESSPAPLNFEEISRKPNKVKESSKMGSPMPENKPFSRDRSASIGTLNLKTPIAQLIGEQNRTMLFQVGRSELRLISPDRKQILLHRAFKDVASCVLGRMNKDHFGFVCRESTSENYACYVFKCESDSVSLEVVNAIKQAFIAHAELLKKSREKSPNMTCEHCPMLWYHRLCHDVEGMNEKKTHAFILRRIEQLPDDEQDLLITKYQGGTNHMYEVNEHNAFLMMLLRAHCEAKQQRHVHDTAENRSEFLNQYLGGSTIFMKAKRSLSSGFDHLLKRRASRDDGVNVRKELSPLSAQETPSEQVPELLTPPEAGRSKSSSPFVNGSTNNDPPSPVIASTVEEESEEDMREEGDGSPPGPSPMMDIFLKVSDNRPTLTAPGTEPDATWRQAIYEKVIQPTEIQEEMPSKVLLGIPPKQPFGKRNKAQLRMLWKMAIDQTILLVRMEKENERLKESEESSAVRRIKLEYTEMRICDAGVAQMWDSLLSQRDKSQPMGRVDKHMLTQAVMQGVPRVSRGGVWYYLAEQYCLRSPPPDVRNFPHYHDPYRTLLSGLTKHQHAILIDLGRTFPKHSYFASALGPGQLALYNILKAYSLLDPDVGYCQGLSFVAGVLLLHMEEGEAFILLRHLMFRRGLRKQYLPDMQALQVQLYQLSRLLRDHEPELHAKLEALDISPALYAAPWMLTLFTSQFPLGFVVRVFDLIFLESLDVVFSISLALLTAHKDGLMLCESCEEAAEYLKHKLPDVGPAVYDRVMKMVHNLDISRQLSDYAVEYAVLREEMPRMAILTEENRHLVADNRRMTAELDSAMDAITSYQKNQTRLETHNKLLDQQLALLSRFISQYHKQEIPPEIKKIVQNYNKRISFSSKILKFTSNDEEDDPKKNFKTGVSAPNLFAKISKEDVMNVLNKEKSFENDRRQFLMKKSQSVHSGLIANQLKQVPLKVLDEKSEHRKSESFRTDILTESLKELGRKNTGFFANTHEQIRQERLFEQQLKHDFDENLKRYEKETNSKSILDDINTFQNRKSMSLNLKSKDLQIDRGFEKIDSGFVTPLSPDDKKCDNCSVISHPLSDCDVDIKFDGQSTKLKQIRPIKSVVRNA